MSDAKRMDDLRFEQLHGFAHAVTKAWIGELASETLRARARETHLEAENARLREALRRIVDGVPTAHPTTPSRWLSPAQMENVARAALHPAPANEAPDAQKRSK